MRKRDWELARARVMLAMRRRPAALDGGVASLADPRPMTPSASVSPEPFVVRCIAGLAASATLTATAAPAVPRSTNTLSEYNRVSAGCPDHSADLPRRPGRRARKPNSGCAVRNRSLARLRIGPENLMVRAHITQQSGEPAACAGRKRRARLEHRAPGHRAVCGAPAPGDQACRSSTLALICVASSASAD
jgi:hypothetical protein